MSTFSSYSLYDSEGPPRLPSELLEVIIHLIWESPLSTSDRASIMKKFLLVTKMWSTIFLRVSFRDVHIPSGEYAERFRSIVTGRSESLSAYIAPEEGDLQPEILVHRCRSVTLHCIDAKSLESKLANPPYPGMTSEEITHPMDHITHITHTLLSNGYFPHLHHISVQFESTADFSAGADVFTGLSQLEVFPLLYPHLPSATSALIDPTTVSGTTESSSPPSYSPMKLSPKPFITMTFHEAEAFRSQGIHSFLVDFMNLVIVDANTHRDKSNRVQIRIIGR